MRGFVLMLVLVFCFACSSTMQVKRPDMIPPEVLHQPPPKEALKLWHQAEAREKQQLFMEAINTYRQIAATFPGNAIAPKALFKTAQIYSRQGRWHAVDAFCSYILKNYPQWNGKGKVYLLMLKASIALRDFNKALSIENNVPDIPEKFLLVGIVRAQNGRFDEASSIFDRYVNAINNSSVKVVKSEIDFAASVLDSDVLSNMLKLERSKDVRYLLHCLNARKDITEGNKEEGIKKLRFILSELPSTHVLTPVVREMLANLDKTAGPTLEPADKEAIGVLLPFNGRYAGFGRKLFRGISLAASEWNEIHPDDPVKVIAMDASGSEEEVTGAFRSLVHKYHVLALLGPLGKRTVNRVVSQPEAKSVLIGAFVPSGGKMKNHPFYIAMMPNTTKIVHSIASYAVDVLGIERFAILYPGDSYGVKAAEAFESFVNDRGKSVVAKISYIPGTTDFKKVIQKLAPGASKHGAGVAVPFDAIFIPDEARVVTLIAPQLIYYNVVGVTLLGTNLWEHPDLVNMANGYMEGACYATPYFGKDELVESVRFRARFKAFYGTDPGFLEAVGYDAMSLFLELRSNTGKEFTRATLLEEARDFHVSESVTGIQSIREDGTLERRLKIITIRESNLVQVYP
ncbi:MAG: penicillin-binding protein activator [Deltaproteobacteria bacterium]|nr:penicillin-binding protein activator [Deltaproteobacteria bacterium]MBW2069100.1 penicillin-binding protein activator [Deltaproteobacteria bacterium]